MLECYPVLSLDGLNFDKLCKFVSRSELVLDADHFLDFLGTHPISPRTLKPNFKKVCLREFLKGIQGNGGNFLLSAPKLLLD